MKNADLITDTRPQPNYTLFVSRVSFNSYISSALTIKFTDKPLTGRFLQWANSFIVENNEKIALTVALVRTENGNLVLANPLDMQFLDDCE